MGEELRELWRFRELFLSMAQRELRIRYKNSVLGVLWSFVNPLLTAAVMTVVFGFLLRGGAIQNFSAYVLSALLPFTFFQMGVLDSAQSVLASLPIVKKVYLPRELLPLAAVASNFVHLLAGFVVFFLYLLKAYVFSGFRENPFQATTWMLPFLLLISLCLTTGVGLIVSALNTFYEDVKHLTNAAMYLLSFLCPIVYFHEDVANGLKNHVWLYRLYMANPMATLSVCYRKALVAPPNVQVFDQSHLALAHPSDFPWGWLAYTAVLSMVILVYGYGLFNRMKWRFVERP